MAKQKKIELHMKMNYGSTSPHRGLIYHSIKFPKIFKFEYGKLGHILEILYIGILKHLTIFVPKFIL